MKRITQVFNNEAFRGKLLQVIVFAGIFYLAYFFYDNVSANLAKSNIASGFDFLEREASFDVGESLIDYKSSDNYSRVFITGALNTIYVSFIGIILAIILGTFVGIMRLSQNWLVDKVAYSYTELVRNTPLLLLLFYCYAVLTNLPKPQEALNFLPGFFLSQRGLAFPELHSHIAWTLFPFLVIAGFIVAAIIRKVLLKHQEKTGNYIPSGYLFILLPILFPTLFWLISGAPTGITIPAFQKFNIEGGNLLTPEFMALCIGLVIYTSANIAEIVRSGILSVGKGQWEAARALGLRENFIMNLIVFPQAFRVMIPPMTNQMLNLTKNSSLAVAIGYPDFVSVTNTTINITGQAIEGVMLIMAFYLSLSLLTSLFMNWFNSKAKLIE